MPTGNPSVDTCANNVAHDRSKLPFLCINIAQNTVWIAHLKKYNLPSLSQLHTFEAVARRMSFTAAADELCLTQSAVSRQIKFLEGHIGRPLFLRKHRAIELTTEGQKLFEAVVRGLDEISSCVKELKAAPETPQITVAASVAFSYYWLMPRLQNFSVKHPEIDLRVLASDYMADLRDGDVDVAVLYGDGIWDGTDTHLLFDEWVYPVCSPDYLEDHPELEDASSILNQTLLHLDGGGNIWGAVDWQTWLTHQGVSGRPERRGISINSYPMVLQAAEAGRGVALGWSYITDAMLADGRLVHPFGKPLKTKYKYYAGTAFGSTTDVSVSKFLEWIINEVAEEHQLT